MSSVRKFQIVTFFLIVISCAVGADIKSEENGEKSPLRWRMHLKKSENISESVKKQTQQPQPGNSESVSGSQLTRSQNYETNAATDLTTIQKTLESVRNDLQNMPTQARQQNYPQNAGGSGGVSNQEYLTQLLNPSAYQNYMYPVPITPVQSIEQSFTNYIPQQLFSHILESVPFYVNPNIPNLINYGTVTPGLQQVAQFAQPSLSSAISNNLISYIPKSGSQPNVASGVGAYDEQNARPMTLPGYAGTETSNFVDLQDISNNGNLFQPLYLPQISTLHQPLDIAQFGAPPLNVINNEFSARDGLFPDVVRNHRSINTNNGK